MNVTIASYSFHGLLAAGMIDVFGYMESCKYRYHLQAADIWNGMLASTDEDYLKKVKEGLDSRELVLANLCVDGAHIWEDDPAAREKNYQNALANLKAGEYLGAKTIRIDAGGAGESFHFGTVRPDREALQGICAARRGRRLQSRPGKPLGA